MKKYKLKKWYPSLSSNWKKGDIVEESWTPLGVRYIVKDKIGNVSINEVENNPEFWEEVIEKDYEILSYKNIASGNIYKRIDEYNYKSEFGNHIHPNNSLPNQINIHSIKRLSDGEIFTVGDKVNTGSQIGTITEFEIINSNKEILVSCDDISCSNVLSNINNIEPLFTTEDGVDIYEGDEYWVINKNSYSIPTGWKAYVNSGGNENLVYLSTREKAEEYIEKHKSKYSKVQINKALFKSGLTQYIINDCKSLEFKEFWSILTSNK